MMEQGTADAIISFGEAVDRSFAAIVRTLEMLGAALDRERERADREYREMSEWVAEMDVKLGRVGAIVADHEERLTA